MQRGQTHSVTGVAQGIPGAVDLAHVGHEVEGDGELASPDMCQGHVFELGEISDELAPEGGGGLA